MTVLLYNYDTEGTSNICCTKMISAAWL